MEGSQETSGCNIFIHQIPRFELNGTDKVCNVKRLHICLHIKVSIPNCRNIELAGSRQGKSILSNM